MLPFLNTSSSNLRLLSLLLRNPRLRPRGPWRRTFLHLLLPRHPRQPVEEQGRRNVEDDESPHDAKVPPPRAILRAELDQIDICVRGRAEFALCCSVGVKDVAAESTDVCAHVVSAGLTTDRVEGGIFDFGAGDFRVGDTGR